MGTVVDALRTDEALGKLALEGLVDLSKTHPKFWKDLASDLVFTVSEIVKNTSFEDGTRSQAAEIIVSLSEQVPATLRKVDQMKTAFAPALVQLVTECEEDDEVWRDSNNDEDETGNNVYSAGIGFIERLTL